MKTFRSKKTYPHSIGLSTCFRQHRATSHCRFLHGYSISVELTFEAFELDHRNWVMDFGGLKPVKTWLVDMFDHKTLVASDDPALDQLRELERMGICELRILPNVGCEAFASTIFDHVTDWLAKEGISPRVRLVSVALNEHEGNGAVVLDT